MDRRPLLRAALACLAGLLLNAAAQAQVFRAYLSSSGVDNPACGLATPCRLLPAAIAAVVNGGEIWMLDSANYNTGPVNVNKSVTILAVPGALGSVVALGGDAIGVATPGVKLTLRNLVIVPYMGSGGSGIYMTAGAALTVQDCLIANLGSAGIIVFTAAIVRVTDTTIRDNAGYGLAVAYGARAFVTGATISGNGNAGVLVSGAAATTTADIADSTFEANEYGVYAYAATGTDVRVSVSDSRVFAHSNTGLVAESALAGGTATLSAGNNRISNNSFGIATKGPGAKVWASGNVVSNNTNYGFTVYDGIFESAGDNAVRNNWTNTYGTITVLPKL